MSEEVVLIEMLLDIETPWNYRRIYKLGERHMAFNVCDDIYQIISNGDLISTKHAHVIGKWIKVSG